MTTSTTTVVVPSNDFSSKKQQPTSMSMWSKVVSNWRSNSRINKNQEHDDATILGGPVSESSSSSTEEIDHISTNDVFARTDFCLHCQNQELILIPSAQGQHILTHNTYFRDLFLMPSEITESRIVPMPDWSIGLARQLVELLTTGSTWLPLNDKSTYKLLIAAAKRVRMELRLASLINGYSSCNRGDDATFFELLNSQEPPLFTITASVSAQQWKKLLGLGIVLLPDNTKLVLIKAAPKYASQLPPPAKERLLKCDTIRSTFHVYASKDRIPTLCQLLTVMENTSNSNLQESFAISYQNTYNLSKAQMDLIWRMAPTSFTFASDKEARYLEHQELIQQEENDDNGVNYQKEEQKTSKLTKIKSNKPRTIGCHSFVVLQQLLETVAQSTNHNNHPEDFPACLIVTAPTPDTLGRLIRAVISTNHNISASIGVDFETQTLYVTSPNSRRIAALLQELADYTASAMVDESFSMIQVPPPASERK